MKQKIPLNRGFFVAPDPSIELLTVIINSDII